MRVTPESLAARQEEMRIKHRALRLKKLSNQLVKARRAKTAPIVELEEVVATTPDELEAALVVITASDRKLLWGQWANLYENGHTIEKIAATHKVSTNRVWYGLSRGGVRMRSQGARPVVKATPTPRADSRRVPGDLSTATLDRMEALAYRISKRKVRLCF